MRISFFRGEGEGLSEEHVESVQRPHEPSRVIWELRRQLYDPCMPCLYVSTLSPPTIHGQIYYFSLYSGGLMLSHCQLYDSVICFMLRIKPITLYKVIDQTDDRTSRPIAQLIYVFI